MEEKRKQISQSVASGNGMQDSELNVNIKDLAAAGKNWKTIAVITKITQIQKTCIGTVEISYLQLVQSPVEDIVE